MQGSSGVLSPPLVASNYTNNTWCRWTYVNPDMANSTLVLNTPNYFIEDPLREYCRYDWLQITGKNPLF